MVPVKMTQLFKPTSALLHRIIEYLRGIKDIFLPMISAEFEHPLKSVTYAITHKKKETILQLYSMNITI